MIDIYTLAYKEISNFLRIWKQTIVPSVITAALYILIFGKFLGEEISAIDNVQYIHYIFPGLLMMSIIMGSYSITAFGFFSAKMFKSLEEILVSPMSTHAIIVGYVIAGITRGIVVGAGVLAVAYIFIENVTISYPLLACIFSILTAIVFSLAGLLNAIFASSWDDVNIIPSFVITPMIYLGGVFYSVSMLDPFWTNLSQFNPILYMINGLRYSFLGVSDVSPIISIGLVIVSIIVLYVCVWYLLKKGVRLKS